MPYRALYKGEGEGEKKDRRRGRGGKEGGTGGAPVEFGDALGKLVERHDRLLHHVRLYRGKRGGEVLRC
jgi:hypothetical protein